MTEPPWLDDVQQRAWRGWNVASRRILAAIERQLRAMGGLTVDDYEVLAHLSEAPGRRLRMSELAASVVQSPSRLSQRVDRMEREGYVCRHPCDRDGRVLWAALTDEGFALLEDAAPGHVEEVRRVFIDRLTDKELAVLAELAPRLAEPVDDVEPEG